MLVLSRKRFEKIVINDNITITVVELKGDKVRIGIEAPDSVRVYRKEVHERILKERGEAS
jgi:carbon storage regulator